MEDGINLMHGEALFDFDDKEVNGLLITLEDVDRIVALTDEDLIFLRGEEFSEFSVTDGGAAELKGGIEE
jgi:hypothetical protein